MAASEFKRINVSFDVFGLFEKIIVEIRKYLVYFEGLLMDYGILYMPCITTVTTVQLAKG